MDDAKALIADSQLRILACDNLDEAAKMVSVVELEISVLFVSRKQQNRYDNKVFFPTACNLVMSDAPGIGKQ